MTSTATIDNSTVIRQALALADELDQIRLACGDECARHVKKTLASTDLRWEDAVEQAVIEWSEARRESLPSIVQ